MTERQPRRPSSNSSRQLLPSSFLLSYAPAFSVLLLDKRACKPYDSIDQQMGRSLVRVFLWRFHRSNAQRSAERGPYLGNLDVWAMRWE